MAVRCGRKGADTGMSRQRVRSAPIETHGNRARRRRLSGLQGHATGWGGNLHAGRANWGEGSPPGPSCAFPVVERSLIPSLSPRARSGVRRGPSIAGPAELGNARLNPFNRPRPRCMLESVDPPEARMVSAAVGTVDHGAGFACQFVVQLFLDQARKPRSRRRRSASRPTIHWAGPAAAARPCVRAFAAAAQAMPPFGDADASLAAGAPFLAVAEPALFMLALALGALG